MCLSVSLCFVVSLAQTQTKQAAAPLPQFEAVSIRPNISGQNGNIGFLQDGFSGVNVPLTQLVLSAYGLKLPYQLLGLPSWAKSAHYDIQARVAESDVPAMKKLGYSQMNRMFVPVLADRFSLRSHWEKRILQTYTLVVARKSQNLREASSGEDSKTLSMGRLHLAAGSIGMATDGTVIGMVVPMSQLVTVLTGETDAIVIDGTGLKGKYDFKMQIPRDVGGVSVSSESASAVSDQFQHSNDLQYALSQIGLKLVPSKTELPVLVVDTIEPCSPN